MLAKQKDKFSLPEHITYLNGAYMSPQLKHVEQIGMEALSKKSHPYLYTADDFFSGAEKLRRTFAGFIDAPDHLNTAIIPSVSYGMASVAKNVQLKKGDEIIIAEAQFPSNVYAWQELAEKYGAVIKIVGPSKEQKHRGKTWNQNILDAINSKTALVAIAPLHWADGTLFNLRALREKTSKHNALLIIDGAQALGALPFSVKEIQPDALITVGYKWLLGPYGLGMAYYSDRFLDGDPIEYSWINRYNSEDFTQLVNYQPNYQPKAGRFNMGEYSNFITVPMLTKSIEQLTEWKPKDIEAYCQNISSKAIDQLRDMGCFIEEDAYRGKHMFGVYLPKHIDISKLKPKLLENNIFVSYRGDAIRVAPNVYNDALDFEKLLIHFK